MTLAVQELLAQIARITQDPKEEKPNQAISRQVDLFLHDQKINAALPNLNKFC